MKLVKIDTSIALFELNLPKKEDFGISKMAARILASPSLANTFARDMGAYLFLNTSKYPNPLSNLPLLSVVMGGPDMTLLYM